MRIRKRILTAGCCAALLTAGSVLTASAGVITMGESQESEWQEQAPEYVPVWGPVLSVTEDRIYINNISDSSSAGEMAITVSKEDTRVLDAVNGFPVDISELKSGEMVFAYLGPAMTMSLPPIANGITIICKAPENLKVPEFMRITNVQQESDGGLTLSGGNGRTYTVPADCTVLPYLTRNIVTLQDLTKDRTCLIWSDEDNKAAKIVLFAQEQQEQAVY